MACAGLLAKCQKLSSNGEGCCLMRSRPGVSKFHLSKIRFYEDRWWPSRCSILSSLPTVPRDKKWMLRLAAISRRDSSRTPKTAKDSRPHRDSTRGGHHKLACASPIVPSLQAEGRYGGRLTSAIPQAVPHVVGWQVFEDPQKIPGRIKREATGTSGRKPGWRRA